MGLSGSIRGHTGTSFVGATRPRWNSGSRRFVRHVCGLAIGASMCFCAGRVGRSTRRRHIVFTRNWACCCAIRPQNAVNPNNVWAMDFVHDQLATGRKIRILTVVDTFSRYVPVLDARFSYKGEDVVATLDRICRKTGYPKTIRVDNGSEFVSRDMDLWAYQRGVTLDFSRPGKPTDNACIEAFNSKLRSECLNAHWFMGLEDTAEKLEAWRRDCNEERPHSAIGNNVPAALMILPDASSPSV